MYGLVKASKTIFHHKSVMSQKLIRYPSLCLKNTILKRVNNISTAPKKLAPQKPADSSKSDGSRRKLFNGAVAGIILIASLAVAYSQRDLFFVKKAIPDKQKLKSSKRYPHSSKDIPNKVPYLLIGGGTASFAAFRAIKSTDPTAKVLVISEEEYYPYMRPPLSKEIWLNDSSSLTQKLSFKQWNGSVRSLFYEPEDFYVKCEELDESENGGVAVARGWKVIKLDLARKVAILDDYSEVYYDKCLIATGASPKNLQIFEKAPKAVKEKITLYRSIKNFENLEDIYQKSTSITIVGGGFLGSELACALGRRGKVDKKKIYQVFHESGNMGKVLPEYLSFWTTEKIKDEGVEVIAKTEITNVHLDKGRLRINLSNGEKLSTDHVIVAVGVKPNTELSQSSGLEIDPVYEGYVVNSELQARSNLYVAGDCSSFYDPKLGRRRVEHHDHAVVSGRLAGENMTGAGKAYLHQSMFWSDLGPDVGYEAIGIIDSSLQTVGVFAKATGKDNPQGIVTTATETGMRSEVEEKSEPVKPASDNKKLTEPFQKDEDYGKGVIFYLRNKKVVGIVLWNVFNRMSVARQVIKENKEYKDLNEVAKLFNIHED